MNETLPPVQPRRVSVKCDNQHAVAALCVTDRAGSSRTLVCSYTAICSRSLLLNGLDPVIADYYLFTNPTGMEGWVGLVGCFITASFRTKWSSVNRRSATSEGKAAAQSQDQLLAKERWIRPPQSTPWRSPCKYKGDIFLMSGLLGVPLVNCPHNWSETFWRPYCF